MSNAELYPLFPSATHPAIPISARILSTLRNLTAPGKGNDLKPEERAALVGIAAVLGCEKIQSKDLPETSAQKASSVSPAHFRSALLRARRLLSQVQAQGDTVQSSPSASGSTSASGSGIGTGSRRSSPRKQASTQSHSHQTQTEKGTKDEHQHKSSGPSIDPLSPFQTPKKKFKYSSGIDVSDLLRSGSATGPGSGSGHPHTPTTGSPLRQSQTPRTANGTARERDGVEGVERTPTKRTKFHPRGVDLSTVDVDTDIETDHENENENDNEADADAETISRSGNGAEGKRVTRRRNDMSAFMALRPGSAGTTPKSQPTKDGEGELPEEEQEYLRSIREKRRTHSGQNKGTKRKVNRRDWTCREVVWGSESVDRQNRIEIDKMLVDVAAYLKGNGRPPVTEVDEAGKLVEILMG